MNYAIKKNGSGNRILQSMHFQLQKPHQVAQKIASTLESLDGNSTSEYLDELLIILYDLVSILVPVASILLRNIGKIRHNALYKKLTRK